MNHRCFNYQDLPTANDSSFWKYKVHADIRGGSSGPGVKRHWQLSTTAIFGDLVGYVFETSEIRQAILYDDMQPLVGR